MYFLRRLFYAVPLLLVISALAFALVHLAPGGPFDSDRAPASPEIERNIKAKYHLDEPIWKQYGRWLGDLTHGDFGVSLKYRNFTVNDIIAQGLPVSATLGGLAFCFAMAVGLPVGFLTAARRGQWQDYIGGFFSVLAVCIPNFVLAPLLMLVFAMKIKLFPVALWESPWHMVLPVIALGLYFAGKVSRIFRDSMIAAAQSEFITAARAKGLGETTLLFKHAFRIALLPVVSYSGPMLADLLTGSFIIENFFQIPGIGVSLINSSLNRDYTVVVGLSLLYAILLVGLNLAVDFAYTLLDPRVKYE
ncbi:MAG TPA: ABC transporter permease [Candidatus Sulfotelmatobacter sp.]|jgi:oligopeptide transport system permease protein|nr:ABC transporter permease [Candidatus Sulfotelmatobacter sp.]